MKLQFKRYFLSGLVTIIPLGITWWVLSFIFRQLVQTGQPLVRLLSRNISDEAPGLSRLLLMPWFDNLLAATLVVVAIYLLGWATNRVLGVQALHAMDRLIARVPLAKSIYGSVKKLIGVLQTKPEHVDRVVLIDFPHRQMKILDYNRVVRDLKGELPFRKLNINLAHGKEGDPAYDRSRELQEQMAGSKANPIYLLVDPGSGETLDRFEGADLTGTRFEAFLREGLERDPR